MHLCVYLIIIRVSGDNEDIVFVGAYFEKFHCLLVKGSIELLTSLSFN